MNGAIGSSEPPMKATIFGVELSKFDRQFARYQLP